MSIRTDTAARRGGRPASSWDRSLALLLAGAACSAPPPRTPLDPAVFAGALDPADFPAAAGILQGFDAIEPHAWRSGDALLFGLELRTGDERRRWLLHLRIDRPVGAGTYRLQATINGKQQETVSTVADMTCSVHDEGGKRVGATQLKVPRRFLRRGITPACRWFATAHRAADGGFQLDAEANEDLRDAIATIIGLFGIMQSDATLSDLMWQLVDKPSIFSVIASFGVRATVAPMFEEARRASTVPPPLPADIEAWVVPLTLAVNDVPVLYCDLLTAPSISPVSVAGGIVGVRGRNPGGNRELTLQLLAARRG